MYFATGIKGRAWFAYSDEQRQHLRRTIDVGGDNGPNTPNALSDGFSVPARAVICLVERVEGRVPNKDIVEVEIYPPFEDDAQQEVSMRELHELLDASNTDAS